jgi:hypothetical protein
MTCRAIGRSSRTGSFDESDSVALAWIVGFAPLSAVKVDMVVTIIGRDEAETSGRSSDRIIKLYRAGFSLGCVTHARPFFALMG